MTQSALSSAAARLEPTTAEVRAEIAVGSESSGLASGATWLVAANLVYGACRWGTLIALAKLVTPAALGHFGLALAVVTPIVLVTSCAVRHQQATDALRDYEFAEYFQFRMAANVVAALLIAACLVWWRGDGAVLLLTPLAFAKLAEATSETCYGLAQRHHRLRYIALSKSTRGALGLVVLLAVVVSGGSLADGVWGMAFAWLGFLLLVDLRVAARLEPVLARPRLDRLWALARQGLPLGAVGGTVALTYAMPRYLLALGHGAAAVGYYTALASLVTAFVEVATGIGNAAAARLGWMAARDTRGYQTLVWRLHGIALAAGAVLVGGAALGGERLLSFLFPPDYAAYSGTLVLVMLASTFWMVNGMAWFAHVAARQLGLRLKIQLIGLAVTSATGVVLVPTWGVPGAAAALALGGAAVAATGALSLRDQGEPA